MKNETKAALGMAIATGGFKTRLFGYFIFYILLIILTSLFLIISGATSPSAGNISIFFGILLIFLVYILPAFPFILWEKSIRKFRRKNGLSVYGDIKEELEQIKFNKEYAKEAKAREAFETSKSSDRMNINYWFELLQKGAITQDEYEAKKRELL